jgi:2-dehydropantoate 2-reductase
MTRRYLVFGAGGIGTYVGGSLAMQGEDVVFVERQRDISDLQKRGLHLVIENLKYQFDSPRCIGNLHQITDWDFDLGILALKTYHLQDILPELEVHKESLPPILCLQNGVDSERMLSDAIGTDRVIPGTVTTAVEKKRKGEVIVNRVRGMAVAGSHPAASWIISQFNLAGLNCCYHKNPDDMKWSKLLLNLLGNATSAILNMTPAEIYAHPGLCDLELQQIREALNVMRMKMISPVGLPSIPVKILAWGVKYLPRQILQPLLIKMVGGGRAGKMPSLHIDLHTKRGKSEVNELNGAVVRAGETLGYPTPINLTLISILNDLVSGELKLKEYANQPDKLLAQVAKNTPG